MKIKGKQELILFLNELRNNCAEIRDRNGNYIDSQIQEALVKCEDIDVEIEE